MTERKGRKRGEDHGQPAAVQAQGDGEKPTHRRVEPVEDADPGDGQPRPTVGHRGVILLLSAEPSNGASGRGLRTARSVTDSSRNPRSSRRLPGAPDAVDAASAT